MLRPYEVFAVGGGEDGQGSYMAVVLVHSDQRAAESNVGLLRRRIEEAKSLVGGQPWADFVDDMEIRADGRVLLGKLRGQRIARIWLDWIYRQDTLLLHE